MILAGSCPRVHGSWTTSWWAGSSNWTALLGRAPGEQSLVETAATLSVHADWSQLLHPVSATRPAPADQALVILAGQQPVLAGGAALVVHKAATAVAMAQRASALLERPVVPVFLLATQDHDSDEVDHFDIINMSNRSLLRTRCRITPAHEMFSRASWDQTWPDLLASALDVDIGYLQSISGLDQTTSPRVSEHPAVLLDRVFGDQGLLLVESHRMQNAGRPVLARALGERPALADALRRGAAALRELNVAPAFDAEDPRPLVLESRSGRRSRVSAGDDGALERLAHSPADFSPHAALRPVVQALALPVLAQVAGPSELLYLAQSRGLHEQFAASAPVLVPRMEATRLPADVLAERGEDLLDSSSTPAGEAEQALRDALRRFTAGIADADPGLLPRLERFASGVNARARRLAEMPTWRGRASHDLRTLARPRGRCQDAVLAWLPDAIACGDLPAYGRHLVTLCRPLESPIHMLHSLPEPSDG